MTIVASNNITVSNVNDGSITHYAYAYSADGTDRFTTVYPNLNLLADGRFLGQPTPKWTPDGTTISKDETTGFFKIQFNGNNVNNRTYYGNGLYEIPVGQKYSISVKAYSLESSLDVKFGTYNGSRTITITNNGNTPNVYKIEGIVKTDSNVLSILGRTLQTRGTLFISEIKLEQGSTATPWMPSSSEATTADYPSYIGQYTDFSSTASTDPAKYAPWTIFKGNDGVGIKTTDITYAISTSGTTAPTTGWTSTVPSLVKGQYLWTKTVWTYTDNSSKTGYSVTYISKDGSNGTNGTSGIIVSSVAPNSPQNGQLWQDTSTTPQLVKKWTGNEWVIWELYAQNLKADTLETLSAIIGKISNTFDNSSGGMDNKGTITIEDSVKVVYYLGNSSTTIDLVTSSSGQGLFTQYLPDKTDASKFKQSWYMPTGLYFTDSINNWNGQITAENVTLVPWTNLTYSAGYTTAEDNPCQYRKIKNLDGSYTVQFRGQIKPSSGSFAVNSTSYVASIPSDIMPLKNAFGIGIPDFNTIQNVRLVVIADLSNSNQRKLQIKVTGGATSYVSLDMLEYTI